MSRARKSMYTLPSWQHVHGWDQGRTTWCKHGQNMWMTMFARGYKIYASDADAGSSSSCSFMFKSNMAKEYISRHVLPVAVIRGSASPKTTVAGSTRAMNHCRTQRLSFKFPADVLRRVLDVVYVKYFHSSCPSGSWR